MNLFQTPKICIAKCREHKHNVFRFSIRWFLSCQKLSFKVFLRSRTNVGIYVDMRGWWYVWAYKDVRGCVHMSGCMCICVSMRGCVHVSWLCGCTWVFKRNVIMNIYKWISMLFWVSIVWAHLMTCICVHACTCMCTWVYVRVCTYVCVFVYVCMCLLFIVRECT